MTFRIIARQLRTGSALPVLAFAAMGISSAPFLAASAAAQEAPAPSAGAPITSDQPAQEIVVTGSRIVRPDLVSSSPVASISPAAIKANNAVTVEQILQVNPQFQPGENSAENNPGLGVATVDLRGLGDNRTLVLIDGKRAPFFDTTGAVDVNSIPTALIKRVDVLTGGASAVYGSDAVAGVVNFVLDDRFTGVRADASSQISGYGDGPQYDASLTAGTKLGDRGNFVISGNYSKRDGVFFGQRASEAVSRDSTAIDPATGLLAFSGSSNTYPTAFDIPGAGRQQIQSNGTLSSTVAGYNTNATNYAQTPLKRYDVTALARYEVTPGIELYGRATYSEVKVKSQLAPTATAGFSFDIHPDNPLLTAGERAAFFDTAANPDLVINPDGSSTVGVRRRVIETGGRLEDHDTKTYEAVAGARGDITSDLHYDVSAQYGEVKRKEVFKNDLSYTALTNALDVVAGPGGTPICRSTLTSPTNGCVPFNLFTVSGLTQQAINYVLRNATQNSKSTQFIVSGSVSGDIGFAKSPFADHPAAFSIGAEYRRERAATNVDPLFASGDLIYYGQGSNIAGSFNVKEVYGELKMPIVQDKPFIHALDLEGGVRYSNYSTVGTVYTYKYGGDYSPIDGIRFRGIFNRTVRAPNIYELYFPVTSGTTSIARDPCVGTVSAQVQALCIAQGAPASSFSGGNSTVPVPIQGQINGFFGGNPGLKAEKTNTYTVGVVVNPVRVRALSVSFDYYNIDIANAIDTVQAQDVINQCFGGGSCAGIARNPIDGSLSGNITYGVPVVYGNLSSIKTDGLDLDIEYHGGSPDRFNYSISYYANYILNYTKQSSPTSTDYQCAGHFGADCNLQPMPKFKHTASLTLGYDWFSATTRWRLIGKVKEDADTDIIVSHIPTFNYFDETFMFDVSKKLQFRIGVQNLANKKPPIVGDTVGDITNFGSSYPQVYDVIGRTFFAGISVKL